MAIKMKENNATRLLADYESEHLNYLLRHIIIDASAFLWREYKKDLIITCIHRSFGENKADGGKPYSAHMDWRAFDSRVTDPYSGKEYLKLEEIKALEAYLIGIYGGALYFYYKKHGTAKHIHMNVNYWARTATLLPLVLPNTEGTSEPST